MPKWISYKVTPTSKVTVRVAIGDAQQGGWAIGFGPGDVKKGSEPDPVPIDGGEEGIIGRTLQVVATVVDVRPETNRLSATVTVSGGPDGDVKVPQSYDDGSDGDVALLTTLVGFE
jgi:hypothetical protein